MELSRFAVAVDGSPESIAALQTTLAAAPGTTVLLADEDDVPSHGSILCAVPLAYRSPTPLSSSAARSSVSSR